MGYHDPMRWRFAPLSSHFHGQAIFVPLLAATIVWGVLLLLVRFTSLLHPEVYDADAPFYFTIGRSILNGLTPYADIFDPKPPGVFLLSAVSLLFFHTTFLGNVVSAGILLAFPLLLTVWVSRLFSDHPLPSYRFPLLLATGFLTGTFFGLWNSLQAGVWQPESFGNFFALLSLLLLATPDRTMSLQRTVAMALSILCAIGFKEPFLLSMGAAALILCPTLRALWHTFLVPAFLALLAGMMILYSLGWLLPYVSIYLPAIAGIRIAGYGSLWLRGLPFWQLFPPLSSTSLFLFPAFVAAVTWTLWNAATHPQKRWWHIAAVLLGGYLSVTAVTLAGNSTTLTYSAVLLPFILAMVLQFFLHLQNASPFRDIPLVGYCLMVSLLLWTIPLSHVSISLPADLLAQRHKLRTAAHHLDNLLSACNQTRYLYAVNPPQPFLPLYTRTSPLNHFPYREIDHIRFGFPFLRRTLERLSESTIIVVNPDGFHPSTGLGSLFQEYMQKTFTTEPWPCALTSLPIAGYRILFRSIPQTITVTETVDPAGMIGLNFEY